jgi:hypothetical protein
MVSDWNIKRVELKSYIKGRNALQQLEISKESELKWKLVDTAESAIDAVSNISKKYGRIAVGAQGVNYGRNGAISLIEIATPHDEVFIFDITTLKDSAFEAGLRHLLTDLNITKVIYDALFHIFSILPTPVLDCQVLYMYKSSNTPSASASSNASSSASASASASSSASLSAGV